MKDFFDKNLFALRLEAFGSREAIALIPLSFGVVVATIVAHGFSAPWVARRLGLDKGPGRKLLLVGSNRWTIALAECLRDLGVGVMIADENRSALRLARHRNIETWEGDILDEVTEDELDQVTGGVIVVNSKPRPIGVIDIGDCPSVLESDGTI